MSGFKACLDQALEILGCDVSRFDYDDKSDISMEFDDVGTIILSVAEPGLVWLWGTLPSLDASSANGIAGRLFGVLAEPMVYLSSNAPMLLVDAQPVRVGGLLRREVLEVPASLAEALSSFHAHVARIQDEIR